GSVLIIRGINWREVVSGIKESVDATPVEKVAQKTRAVLSGGRRSGPAKSVSEIKTLETSSVESVRVVLRKVLELPSLDALSKSPTLSPMPVTDEVPRIFSVTENDSTDQLLPPPSEVYTLTSSNPEIVTGIELIDEKQKKMAGFVSVNSLAPARIYVDGEFSGVTPRTIKLTPGDHQIWLIANGYEDWMRRVRLKSKQQVNIVAWLKKKPKP
ncbi:MAG: PEGA domain-containing protein, partial [Acidobacteria bacterium]|nr:PEGA domain-containing protein [Acidobacteriota bacterium]